jgi:hypothetical protein
MPAKDAVEVLDLGKALDGADDGEKLPLVLLGREAIIAPASSLHSSKEILLYTSRERGSPVTGAQFLLRIEAN